MTRHLLFVAVLTVVALFSLFVGRSSLSNAPATSDARVSARSVHVSSYVAGKVKELSVRDGSLVRKGDLLMQIDPEIYLSVARLARMRLDAALVVRSTLSGTAERSQSSFIAATEAAQLAMADAEVKASSAALELAELNLSRTVVRASVNGYVANLDVGVGDFVAEHRLTMELVDTDSYYVHACFAESDLSQITVGAPVRIRFGPGELVVDGRVRSIDPMMTVRADPDPAYLSAAFESTFRRHRTVRCVGTDIEFDTFPAGYHPLLDAAVNVALVVLPAEAPTSGMQSLLLYLNLLHPLDRRRGIEGTELRGKIRSAQGFRIASGATTQANVPGARLSALKMAVAGLVQTKDLGLWLCSAM